MKGPVFDRKEEALENCKERSHVKRMGQEYGSAGAFEWPQAFVTARDKDVAVNKIQGVDSKHKGFSCR